MQLGNEGMMSLRGIPILILRLEGVLQSWGEHSKWNYRDSAPLPTKSGIIGMIGCAMGLMRESEELRKLAENLKIAVRADRPGREVTDFQTIQSKNLLTAQGKHRGKRGEYETLVTYRTYLQDACFTVAISGEKKLLTEIENAFWNPKWPIYLGRKNCVPSRPVCDGLTEEYDSLKQAMQEVRFADLRLYDGRRGVLVEIEESVADEQEGSSILRQDMIAGTRHFQNRSVRRYAVERGESSDPQ